MGSSSSPTSCGAPAVVRSGATAACIVLAWAAILAAAILRAGVLTTCGSQRSRGVGWGVGAGLAAAVIAVGLFALSQRFERR